jgi:hypothetical protein
MSRLLEPLAFPLHGSRLIEASAGTGKTWTIAALYLRLVLGHAGEDGESGYGRPLLPPEILVMTFTRAATRELSNRVRERLVQAAGFFRGEEFVDDPYLEALADGYEAAGGEAARMVAAHRLVPRRWTRRRSSPSTRGASACCANMRSTAAACSTRNWSATRRRCSRTPRTTTGASTCTP